MGRLDDLKVEVRITVSNPSSGSTSELGHGVAKLCQGVRETGSLYASAKRMGMSYSKAWHVVHNTEEALGIQLLERDGARGSTLTPDCERLIDVFERVKVRLNQEANQMYKERLAQGEIEG